MWSYSVAIQMKAIEQYFSMIVFIVLYKVVLTFESMHEVQKFYHSNESHWSVLSCGTVYYAIQGSNKVVLTFESEILLCDH